MGKCDERVQAIHYLSGDGVVHEKVTFFGDGKSEIRAQREEETDRIRRTRGHHDVFPGFVRFFSQFQNIVEGVGNSGRQRS